MARVEFDELMSICIIGSNRSIGTACLIPAF
jgi:hypothetical protein